MLHHQYRPVNEPGLQLELVRGRLGFMSALKKNMMRDKLQRSFLTCKPKETTLRKVRRCTHKSTKVAMLILTRTTRTCTFLLACLVQASMCTNDACFAVGEPGVSRISSSLNPKPQTLKSCEPSIPGLPTTYCCLLGASWDFMCDTRMIRRVIAPVQSSDYVL